MLEQVTLIINDGPGKVMAWNAFRLACALAQDKVPLYVFLLDDGVYTAKKGQNPPEGLEELDLTLKLQELLAQGVRVEACGTCLKARGITQTELLEGVTAVGMKDLAKMVQESAKVLTF